MEQVEARKETKEMWIKLKVIDGISQDTESNLNSLYPASGTYILKRSDGLMSVVNVNKGSEKYVCMFQEVFVGAPESMEGENVMDCREVNEKMDDMIRRYDKDVEMRKRELESEFEKKEMQLRHEYEMRMKELESEMPKRFEQGEWISGKTLTEIVKTLAGRKETDDA